MASPDTADKAEYAFWRREKAAADTRRYGMIGFLAEIHKKYAKEKA